MASTKKFKPKSFAPPQPPTNPQVLEQVQRGSERGKAIVEQGVRQSANYIPGQQGWRYDNNNFEMHGENMTIDTRTPKIEMSDGSNDRLFIGNTT